MNGSLTTEIVNAVAETEGVQPQDLDYTLQHHIDMDALEQLADRSSTPWTLSFELPDHSVTVTSDGTILVDNRQTKTWTDLS
jgi:regulator of RNase E activity RraB